MLLRTVNEREVQCAGTRCGSPPRYGPMRPRCLLQNAKPPSAWCWTDAPGRSRRQPARPAGAVGAGFRARPGAGQRRGAGPAAAGGQAGTRSPAAGAGRRPAAVAAFPEAVPRMPAGIE
ncbi:hypothetical protein G6F31_019318 [Rhizopus arrhizus]|nr:hypothetical protein G6F31_019318 [Rhizopus arrhizus]